MSTSAPRDGGTSIAAPPDEIVVLSWAGRWGSSLRATVSDPFTAATGVRVRHRTHVGLKLPADLTDALRRGERPPVDVVWCNGAPALRAARAGWCQRLDDDDAMASLLAALHPRARPEGVTGWPIAFAYAVHYVLVYRRDAFPRGGPTSWDVLLEPRMRERIALYPGGNGFYPVAQALGGGATSDIPGAMGPCWGYLERLRPQVGTLDYSIGMSRLLAEARLDLCFRALTNALGFREEGQDVGWSAPREGITDTMDALWVPRGLPAASTSWARRYVAHALSREIQGSWCERMGVLPVHPLAALPGLFRDGPRLPRSLDDRAGLLWIPEIVKANHEEAWEARFDAIFA